MTMDNPKLNPYTGTEEKPVVHYCEILYPIQVGARAHIGTVLDHPNLGFTLRSAEAPMESRSVMRYGLAAPG